MCCTRWLVQGWAIPFAVAAAQRYPDPQHRPLLEPNAECLHPSLAGSLPGFLLQQLYLNAVSRLITLWARFPTELMLHSSKAGAGLRAQIFVEIERARLTKQLARLREQEGKIDEAADILQEVAVVRACTGILPPQQDCCWTYAGGSGGALDQAPS